MYRPSKNLVVARESLPAFYRPSNQMLLVRSNSANPQPGDPQSMLPGMGEVRLGNGFGSNGLASGAADTRLAQHIVSMRMQQAERASLVQSSGTPNGRSRPVMTVALNRALADLPAAPSQGALQVDLSWSGNSLQSEQWIVRDALGLRPIKAFGKKQTYVTTTFGTDIDALQDALKAQPIISVLGVQVYSAPAVVNAVAPQLLWEHVDTIDIPTGEGLRWIITRAPTSTGFRYAVTLYRHRADSDDEVVRSDNLADEQSARDYIKSYEVKQNNFGGVGRPRRTLMWNGMMRKGGDANIASAAARASRAGFSVINAPGPEAARSPARISAGDMAAGTSGLGAVVGSIPPLVLVAAAIGAFVLLTKHR